MSNSDAHDGLHEFQHTGFDLVINGYSVCTTVQVVKDGIVSVFYSLRDVVQIVKKGYVEKAGAAADGHEAASAFRGSMLWSQPSLASLPLASRWRSSRLC